MAMEKTCRIGKLELGAGVPKICIPVMGKDLEEIARGAYAAVEAGADIIELRIDSLSHRPSEEQVIKACFCVQEVAEDTPLLLTFRTKREGGKGNTDGYYYIMTLLAVAQARACDAIDVEISSGEQVFKTIASAAHAAGMSVVGSSHEFGEIGDMTRIDEWMKKQQAWGADICKVAVMAHSKQEALTLACRMNAVGDTLDKPYIAIAMGPDGVFTRAACESVGSCMTFASAAEASAPGQMDARLLAPMLGILHEAGKKEE